MRFVFFMFLAGVALCRSSSALAEITEQAIEPTIEQTTKPTPNHRISLSSGFGSEYGIVGFGIEIHGASREWSVLGGFGMIVAVESQTVDGDCDDVFDEAAAWGVGGRRYFQTGKHRLHLQGTVGVVSYWYRTRTWPDGAVEIEIYDRNHGVTTGLGYEYQAYSGFTFNFGAHVPWEPSAGLGHPYPSLGVGYSW